MTKKLFYFVIFVTLIISVIINIHLYKKLKYNKIASIYTDTVIQSETIYIQRTYDVGHYASADKQNLREKPADIVDTSLTKIMEVPLTCIIISSEDNSFGYEIYMGGRLYIKQPSIPGLPGNRGFNDRTNARKVAELVITKIKNNISPPSVTLDELKKLNVID